MSLINISSSNSIWRGLGYYKEKKVIDYQKINTHEYIGTVLGNNNKKYNVSINLEHPRKSTCNCPHAKDKRIICKHMIALYFTVQPKEVKSFLNKIEESQKKYVEYEEKRYKETLNYINSLSKNELIDIILDLLEVSPEWVYDRFIKDKE